MEYLDRLKGMNSEKCQPLPLQELQKDPSYSFCSSHGARFKKITPLARPAGDTATASHWWLIHYPDRDTVELPCYPDATHAEIMERHPGAVAAEPFTPTIRQASAPMTASEETAIRAWLALIEETDPAIIDDVLSRCRHDAEALAYFTGRAAAGFGKAHTHLP